MLLLMLRDESTHSTLFFFPSDSPLINFFYITPDESLLLVAVSALLKQ